MKAYINNLYQFKAYLLVQRITCLLAIMKYVNALKLMIEKYDNNYCITYVLDTPHEFKWKGVYADANLRTIEIVPSPLAGEGEGEGDRQKTFMELSALQGSILENRIFEDDFQVESISTAKLFQIARNMQPATEILTIDKTNIDTILPTLPFDDNIKEDIQNAVNQNYEIRIPRPGEQAQSEIVYQDWTGIGYIKENPETGEAGYMLSGMIAGSETAITPEEWVNQDLVTILSKPYSPNPNTNPLSAAKILKISATDRQKGTVGKLLPQPLMVFIVDKNSRPVHGASVTFRVIAGGGTFNGSDTYIVTTGKDGIVKAPLTLGQKTSDNPTYLKINTADEFVTQIGLNIVTTSVNTTYGNISITQPFEAYGKPDVPFEIKKGLGDGNKAVVNNPGGSLTAEVIDQYGNPISNAVLTFTAMPAESVNPSVSLPEGYRNIEFYKKEECSNPYPLYGECTTVAVITQKTQYFGGIVWTILGNTVNTKYTVRVMASTLPPNKYEEFNLYSLGSRESTDSYAVPGLHMGYINIVTDKGQPVNAAAAGMQLKAPIVASLYMYHDDFTTEGPYTCIVSSQPTNCWRVKSKGLIKTTKIVDGAVIFTALQGSGSVTSTKNLQNGLYSTEYTTGIEPAINKIAAEGEATITVSEVFYDPDTNQYAALAETPPTRSVSLKSGQMVIFDKDTQEAIIPTTVPPTQILEYTVYGVLPEITGTTPDVMTLNPEGYLTEDTTIRYSIKPVEYNAIIADIDIYEREPGSTNPNDDEYAFSLTGDRTQGDGTAIIYQGEYFDITKEYFAEVVLNGGSDVEIRGEKHKIDVTQFDIDFAVCESQCIFGVKENLVYADGLRDTRADVLVRTKGKLVDWTKLRANVQTDNGNLKDIGSTDQNKQISKFLDVEGKAALTYVSHIETAKSTLQADVRDSSNDVVYSRNSTEIFNFKYCKANNYCYDFNEIMSDAQYTTTPSFLDTQEEIEAWLKGKGSGLVYRGIGEIDATQTIIPVDSGDNNNAAIPSSGTIKIENEEIIYSGQTTTDFYVPALVATSRGANGTVEAMHGDIQKNTNISVYLKTTLTSALSPTDTTINVASTDGAKTKRDKDGLWKYFIQVEQEEVKCNSVSGNSFIGCSSLRSQTYASNTPLFYEIGRLGALVSRVIDYETKDEIQRSGYVSKIGNGTLIGAGKPVSAALILTHLGKEKGCIKAKNLTVDQMNLAMGVASTVNSEVKMIPTWLLDQLTRGIATARNRFYEITETFPFITGISNKKNDNFYYVQPNVEKDVPVKFKIKNKATKALFKYTNYVTSKPVKAYGGNALFWWFWDDFGFNK